MEEKEKWKNEKKNKRKTIRFNSEQSTEFEAEIGLKKIVELIKRS